MKHLGTFSEGGITFNRYSFDGGRVILEMFIDTDRPSKHSVQGGRGRLIDSVCAWNITDAINVFHLLRMGREIPARHFTALNA